LYDPASYDESDTQDLGTARTGHRPHGGSQSARASRERRRRAARSDSRIATQHGEYTFPKGPRWRGRKDFFLSPSHLRQLGEKEVPRLGEVGLLYAEHDGVPWDTLPGRME